jgi:hypothetical protein
VERQTYAEFDWEEEAHGEAAQVLRLGLVQHGNRLSEWALQ